MNGGRRTNSPDGLNFDEFRSLATKSELSSSEKVGFPEEYRVGRSEQIFDDIARKLPPLLHRERAIVDIGPGCSELALFLIRHCQDKSHSLTLIDSQEMLDLLPDGQNIRKVPGRFPTGIDDMNSLVESADAVVCYSVLQYEFSDGNLFQFLDAAVSLLRPGGSLLLGDIPNVSMRKRFFAGDAGVAFHKASMGTDEVPEVRFNRAEPFRIDDAILVAIILRTRAAGYNSFVLPQDPALPMANRREDLLIVRP